MQWAVSRGMIVAIYVNDKCTPPSSRSHDLQPRERGGVRVPGRSAAVTWHVQEEIPKDGCIHVSGRM